MLKRILFLILGFSLFLFSESFEMADKVIIKKSTRMLYLSSQGEIYRKFHMALGRVPMGHKEYEGDMKTPEGVYLLDWRQPSPQYYRSIHISYPNQKDRAHAKELGLSAGGMIMIHGTPFELELSPFGNWMPILMDWTEGCIAMSNDDLDEVWDSTTNNTPVVIIP